MLLSFHRALVVCLGLSRCIFPRVDILPVAWNAELHTHSTGVRQAQLVEFMLNNQAAFAKERRIDFFAVTFESADDLLLHGVAE